MYNYLVFLKESLWIKDRIMDSNLKGSVDIIDIGSASPEYREIKQPYVANLFEWIKTRYKLKTLDFDPNSEANFICDITNPSVLSIGQFSIVIASNILEHVEESKFQNAVDNIQELVKTGGYLIVTVPYNIALHDSPIDNGFRPDVQKLCSLFKSNFDLVAGESLVDRHYREPYLSNPKLLPLPIVTCVFLKKKS